MRDLRVAIPRSPVEPRINQLYDELDAHEINFKPRCWFSSEWFSPDQTPGIAIPFYLAHERLMKLEYKQMLSVEGGGRDECLRILRHETGHAIDTAYQLRRRKRYRELFGRFGLPYPDTYKPNPNSRRFVFNLPGWYAQAHPAEDFAETFAVWMRPGWKSRYRGWHAIKKLEYIDELMDEIHDQKPRVYSATKTESLPKVSKKLRDHYREKKIYYADEWPDFYDRDLRRLFSADKRYANQPTAASFLRSLRREVREEVADWTGVHPYTIDQVIRDMIDRCKELKFRLAQPASKARFEARMMVTVQTMNFLHLGRHRIAL